MNRRDFLKTLGGAAVVAGVSGGYRTREDNERILQAEAYSRVSAHVYSGAELDRLGRMAVSPAVIRRHGETDHALRKRLLAEITRS